METVDIYSSSDGSEGRTAQEQFVTKEAAAPEKVRLHEQCVHELFEEQAQRKPDAIAVMQGAQQITYQELDRRADQLANFLRHHGVRPESRVGLYLERSLELITAMLAVLKAGGAYVPLDTEYPQERLIFMANDAQITISITRHDFLQRLSAITPQVYCLDCLEEELAQYSSKREKVPLSPMNLIYMMYTSGSTGQPKGVSIVHRGVVRLVNQNNYADMSEDQTWLQIAPVAFDASTLEIWAPLLSGGKLVLYSAEPFSIREFLRVIRHYQVTTVWLPTGLFHQVMELESVTLEGVSQLLTGGEVMSPEHARYALRKLSGGRLVHAYGPTENTTFTSCFCIDNEWQIGTTTVSIGHPIGGTQIYILDDDMRPVPPGTVGELYTGGDGLARGYWNHPDRTAECFVPHPWSQDGGERLYRTGDLAYTLEDGRIEFVGRKDAQVKVRGFRVELGEVEAVLSQHELIQHCVVLAEEDERKTKQLIAYVILKSSPMLQSGTLRRYMQNRVPDYMVPSLFVQLDKFPLNPQGKVDRQMLRTINKRSTASSGEENMPKTATEKRIAQVWQALLELETVGIHENFFELGGHSLLFIQMHEQLEHAFEREIPLENLIAYTTISSLAAHFDQEGAGEEA